MPPDTLLADNPRAVIGDNSPPPTPFEIASKTVNDIYEETTLWLDGHKIDSQELADGVGNLLAEIRKAEKLADENRKAEKKEHDDAIAKIQAKYNELIGNTKSVKGKTVRAAEACKAALQPWLVAEDARLRAEAQAKREEADRQRQEAEEALRASDAQNLAEREAAEAALSVARKAETAANVASRQSATAGGTFGRAAGLRTVHIVTIDDPVIAARTVWTRAREELLNFMQEWAERQVRGGAREMPGFSITEEKRAA